MSTSLLDLRNWLTRTNISSNMRTSRDSSGGTRTLRKPSPESTDRLTTTSKPISRILNSSSRTSSEDTLTQTRPSPWISEKELPSSDQRGLYIINEKKKQINNYHHSFSHSLSKDKLNVLNPMLVYLI